VPQWKRGDATMASSAEAAIVPPVSEETVRVELGARSYDVVVGVDVLDTIGGRMAALGFRGRCGLVTNDRVGALYRGRVERSLALAGMTPVVVQIPDGEEHKTLATLSGMFDTLLRAGIERGTPLVALGGGVVGDVTGFAAATLLRGLPIVQAPTTLLAQVDAAIGGKTAIDHPVGKNLIGAFHQPRLVVADVGVLGTLPRRELLAGLAEVVKYGVIGDAKLFAGLERDPSAVLTLDPTAFVPIVAACGRQKAAVVAADEREERGERAVLNFGHTIGHALEAVTGYGRFLHGEAVAIGMVAAARVSAGLGLCDTATVDRIAGLLGRLGLPVAIPNDVPIAALGAAMRADKKSVDGRIRFIAVEQVGRVTFASLTAQDIVDRL
jgi:3-dehydroquinate synthase